ncbi:GumC family protein [Limimaricola hongkongensis]|uniref:non-specific protein-tyrosine kinase n=1 Tax=Limimaricola hongkongensis DSM 17492 TaxID=1122180 RepID=A0A017H7S1_9RHOB|nr:polysaccharide biosynthesis tyrosine autokinase [Limimaricola hongkongensis]EYD70360.1 Non-specific protein-tyrosine kinase [Limimaricola hongkongensis DSM 17492]
MNETVGSVFQRNWGKRNGDGDGGGELVVNFTEFFRILRRGLWIIAACFLVGGFVSYVMVKRVPPTYTAASQILLGKQSQADNLLGDLFEGLALDGSQIPGQIALMQSGRLLSRVAEQLELDTRPEFNAALRPDDGESVPLTVRAKRLVSRATERVMAALGRPAQQAATGAATEGADADSPLLRAARAERQSLGEQADYVAGLSSGLRVRQVGNTALVDIYFVSPDPTIAAAVVNSVADQYIAFQLEEKLRGTRRITEGLNERIASLRLQVEAAEGTVVEFRDRMLGSNSGGTERFEQQIRELSSRLVQVNAAQAEIDGSLREIDRLIEDQGLLAVIGVLESDLLGQLEAERAALQMRMARLEERFEAGSPRIAEAADDVARVEQALGQEIMRLRDLLANEAAVAAAKAGSIRDQLRNLEQRFLTLSQQQIRLGQLEREAEASRLVYESFLSTFTQTSEIGSLQEADARVVSYAQPPRAPSAPNKKVAVFLGLVAGLFAGLALVFLRAFLDRSIDSPEKLRRLLGDVPVVASLPSLRRFFRRVDPVSVVNEKGSLALAEGVRTLRNTLMLRRTEPGWKVAVISAQKNEGKTTTSLLLAHAAVRAGKSCIVVETDLRKSSIAKVLDLPTSPDIVDVLLRRVPLKEALRKDPKTGAHVLSAQPDIADPAGLLLSDRMTEMVHELEQLFDLIIFDTSPLVLVSDALPVARLCDDVVLTVRWKRSDTNDLRDCLSMLRVAGVPITCAVMTMTREREAPRYYYREGSEAAP